MAQQGNANWSLPIPALAQHNNLTPGQGGLPTGPFKGRITGSQHITPDPTKPGAVEFNVVCTEQGEFNGRELRVTCWIAGPESKPGVLAHWKNLIETVAPHALGAPQTLGPASFVNKDICFYSKAPAEGETRADGKAVYNEYTFITPAQYQKMKAAAAAMAAQGGQANTSTPMGGASTFTPPPPAQPGLGGAPQGFAGVPVPPQGQPMQQGGMGQLGQQFQGQQPQMQQMQQPQGFAQPQMQQPGFAPQGQPMQQQQMQQPQQQGFAGVPQPGTQTVPF